MRYTKAMSAMVLLSLVATSARASDPSAIDKLIDQLVTQRSAVAAAVKAEAATLAELKDAVTALQKRLADLGLNAPPGPGPVNPPVPFPPVDPLTGRLKVAYLADGGPTKAATLADLVELMKQAGTLADDPAITTVGQLAGKVATAAGVLAKDQLLAVRAILKAELAAAFPADGPLSPDTRNTAKAVFLKLQTALTEAGK